MKLGKLIAQAFDLWTQCPAMMQDQCNWIAGKLLEAPLEVRQQIIRELAFNQDSDACEHDWIGLPGPIAEFKCKLCGILRR